MAETPKGAVMVHAQYLRDLSFENPHAPQSLRGGAGAPEMDVKIGIDARQIPGDDPGLHEVVLSLRAEATRGEQKMFIAEMTYGVAVGVGEGAVPEDKLHPLLHIEIPRMAFPFARQILADATVRGGYPPLLLQPVDFAALYHERFAKEGKQEDTA
ncbi:MAG TPA: protein-export chaperone SecB [Rhodospirillaceae bacterium]|jgi:preprotein translocase subunit SecB|nr:protein-export chaperone SecB [Alphaproteobacteria bacterium]HBH25989.1 protein-export chaperone SecB [Rhodospirillaceae bacterium]